MLNTVSDDHLDIAHQLAAEAVERPFGPCFAESRVTALLELKKLAVPGIGVRYVEAEHVFGRTWLVIHLERPDVEEAAAMLSESEPIDVEHESCCCLHYTGYDQEAFDTAYRRIITWIQDRVNALSAPRTGLNVTVHIVDGDWITPTT